MIEIVLSALMAITMTMPPLPAPAQYVVRTQAGLTYGYSPKRGWIPYAECAVECWVPANQRTQVMSGEFTVGDFCPHGVTIYENGRPRVWISQMFVPGQCGVWRE